MGWPYSAYHLAQGWVIKKLHGYGITSFDDAASVQNLVLLSEVLAQHKIFFWLSEGTALGAVREGRLLPHDDDVDIGIFDTQLDDFVAALPALEAVGFALSDIQSKYFFKLVRRFETVDVDMTGPGHYCHACSGPCEEVLPHLQNFTQATVSNISFTVPPVSYLVRLYTEGWQVPQAHWKPPIHCADAAIALKSTPNEMPASELDASRPSCGSDVRPIPAAGTARQLKG
eukprot:CAMPEP_0114543906 /NCGR_PEP_ID=MMETSP0114-20121206/2600_1 /TAXON_ID=31324 /ORGANISM="Goniomonas sp, Strain m" /LENGTH=228 /DNA_ID=CAMNT_0001728265 /DNA_START=110 /DNA_END=797 /DNA_ORIENTATION=+